VQTYFQNTRISDGLRGEALEGGGKEAVLEARQGGGAGGRAWILGHCYLKAFVGKEVESARDANGHDGAAGG
jgi:hypothetical protein